MNLTKLLVAICFTFAWATVSRAADPLDYQRDVFPILESYCLGCHTSDEAEGGMVMESHAATHVRRRFGSGGHSGITGQQSVVADDPR